MSTTDPEFNCPSGGSFYACASGTRFLGCCSSTGNVCADGCPSADLTPMSFNKNYTHTIPDQICPITHQYWSCHHQNSDELPFLGCCSVDACQTTGGCPQQSLGPAQLNLAYVSFYVTTTSSSRIESPTASPSTSPSPPSGSGVPVGAVAGAVAGGVVLLLAVIAAVFFLCCTKQGKRNSRIMSERLGLMNQEKDRYSISPYNFQEENKASSPSPDPSASWNSPSIDHRISQPPAELPLTELSPSKHARNLSADIATPQAQSPAMSGFTASPVAPNERWSAAHSQISELAGSDVSPRPGHGSWSPTSPGRLESRTVGDEGVRYEPYRSR